jgi:hypothetical protein
MERISTRMNNENNDIIQFPPPPPYTSVVYKLDENQFDRIPPPSYSDIDGQSITYINNYPGPPLTDGQVQGVQDSTSTIPNITIPKKMRVYFLVNGIITILLGIVSIGLQIAILASNSIIYYYYGFWGGGIIIGIGISTILFYKRHHNFDYSKLCHSFFWQTILVAIVFGVGIIIIVTDKCNDNNTENNANVQSCEHSYQIINGFLLGIFALAFVQSIINTIVFGILKR